MKYNSEGKIFDYTDAHKYGHFLYILQFWFNYVHL